MKPSIVRWYTVAKSSARDAPDAAMSDAVTTAATPPRARGEVDAAPRAIMER
jgi:hypothetical protein